MEHGGASVIHINYKSAQVDQVYFPQVEVIGDIALSMDELADCLLWIRVLNSANSIKFVTS